MDAVKKVLGTCRRDKVGEKQWIDKDRWSALPRHVEIDTAWCPTLRRLQVIHAVEGIVSQQKKKFIGNVYSTGLTRLHLPSRRTFSSLACVQVDGLSRPLSEALTTGSQMTSTTASCIPGLDHLQETAWISSDVMTRTCEGWFKFWSPRHRNTIPIRFQNIHVESASTSNSGA